MKRPHSLALAVAGAIALSPLVIAHGADRADQAQTKPEPQKPVVQVPKPGVPQIMTLEGQYVRAAYNNEAYVILGYRIANASVGEEWLMLELGTTMREGRPSYKLKRSDVTLDLPDGTRLSLASNQDYNAANLTALQQRDKVMRDSINYFPPMATQPCRIGFFNDLGSRGQVWDDVELSQNRACLGRLFFKVPGGIKYGQHWLNVQFQSSLVRTPFRIFTKDEEKLIDKNYDDIKKQVDAAFKKKT